MTWVMRRAEIMRQTCRHARESVSPSPTIAHTKDGRWVMANLGNRPDDGQKLIALLDRYGMAEGLDATQTVPPRGGRFVPGVLGVAQGGPFRRPWQGAPRCRAHHRRPVACVAIATFRGISL